MNNVTSSARVAFLARIFLFLGLGACKAQPMPSQPVSPSAIQPSSAVLTAVPTVPRLPLSDAQLKNFFGDAACSWPCWQGITPGITSGNEAVQRLKDSLLISSNSITVDEPKTGFGDAKWYWKISGERALEGKLEWRNNIALYIALTVYPTVSLGEIISRFGPPEKLEVINCSLVVEGPQKWCATLYYAKNGFAIQYNRDSAGFGDDIQITESDSINFVTLFRPSTIEDWLASMSFDLHPDLRDWKGYGNLLDLYYYQQ